jgi:hypothetical protein
LAVVRINTSDGIREVHDASDAHTINTSRVVEEDLNYTDEEVEVVHTTPALDWCVVVGGESVPLILFATLEDGRTYGVTLGSDGRIDVSDDVEDRPGFKGYQRGVSD